jgi:hypothetical protein
MMYRHILRHALCVLVITGCCLTTLQVPALAAERIFKTGERVEIAAGTEVEVLGCRGSGDNEQCEIQYFNSAAADGKGARVWVYTSQLRDWTAAVAAKKGGQGTANQSATNQTSHHTTSQQGHRNQARTSKATTQNCPCDPHVAEKPRINSVSAVLFKHLIYETYQAEVNGSTTAPMKIGISFQSFRIGAPVTNRITRYGVDYPTAANGAKLYPIESKYTLCRLYKGGPARTLFDGRWVCFKNKFGKWVCATAPGHRILGYQ